MLTQPIGFAFRGNRPEPAYVTNAKDERNREIPIVYVEMDDTLDGYSISSIRSRVFPFAAKSHIINNKFSRLQLPLEIAHASTIHSVQSLTCKNGIVLSPSYPKPFAPFLEYVAITRVKDLDHLFLTSILKDFHFNSRYFSKIRILVKNEYERLNNLKDNCDKSFEDIQSVINNLHQQLR